MSVPLPRSSTMVHPLAVVGAAGVLVSLFTEWGTEALFGESLAGHDIPIEFLNDTTPSSLDTNSITFFLVPAIAAIVAGMFVAAARWLTVAGGAVALIVGLWYVKAVNSVTNEDFYDFDDAGLTDLVGPGAWLCIAAGVVAVVAGVLMIRTQRAVPLADHPSI